MNICSFALFFRMPLHKEMSHLLEKEDLKWCLAVRHFCCCWYRILWIIPDGKYCAIIFSRDYSYANINAFEDLLHMFFRPNLFCIWVSVAYFLDLMHLYLYFIHLNAKIFNSLWKWIRFWFEWFVKMNTKVFVRKTLNNNSNDNNNLLPRYRYA